jgi:hypothetical protein
MLLTISLYCTEKISVSDTAQISRTVKRLECYSIFRHNALYLTRR